MARAVHRARRAVLRIPRLRNFRTGFSVCGRSGCAQQQEQRPTLQQQRQSHGNVRPRDSMVRSVHWLKLAVHGRHEVPWTLLGIRHSVLVETASIWRCSRTAAAVHPHMHSQLAPVQANVTAHRPMLSRSSYAHMTESFLRVGKKLIGDFGRRRIEHRVFMWEAVGQIRTQTLVRPNYVRCSRRHVHLCSYGCQPGTQEICLVLTQQ